MPAAFSRSAAWYWRTVLPFSVRRAATIITDSEHAAREIRELFGLEAERIVVIPLGVDPQFRPIDDATERARVQRRYALPDEFLLFVGVASPRKNLDRLVRAFAALPERSRHDVHLVLAGPSGWRNETFAHALEASPVADRVHRLGVVPDADLPVLHALARGAVNLSASEGFALPALEALACGTPLLCADTSAFPELVGNCALLVSPDDEDAITAALATLLAGGPEIAANAARGRARAATFTWRQTARATLAVYERVARVPG
jgi:alpha-1,3-rhamnosyl/mannosyltransferase